MNIVRVFSHHRARDQWMRALRESGAADTVHATHAMVDGNTIFTICCDNPASFHYLRGTEFDDYFFDSSVQQDVPSELLEILRTRIGRAAPGMYAGAEPVTYTITNSSSSDLRIRGAVLAQGAIQANRIVAHNYEEVARSMNYDNWQLYSPPTIHRALEAENTLTTVNNALTGSRR